MSFRSNDFKRITLEDAATLAKKISRSNADSCEFAFGNLYIWGFPYNTEQQIWNHHIYLHFPEYALFFPEMPDDRENPSARELAEVVSAMKEADGTDNVFQVRRSYLDAHPDVTDYFDISPISRPEAEYIYSVQALVELRGEKLGKKKNLIKQFLQLYPQVEVRQITPDVLMDCLTFSEEWRLAQPDPDSETLRHEAEALAHLAEGYSICGFDGVAAYVDGILVAYAIGCPVNQEMFTESFEKARSAYKGAAQFINRELAKKLAGKYLFLNREQDLDDEGLRHAKLSYAPLKIQQNFRLTLKENIMLPEEK